MLEMGGKIDTSLNLSPFNNLMYFKLGHLYGTWKDQNKSVNQIVIYVGDTKSGCRQGWEFFACKIPRSAAESGVVGSHFTALM